MFSSARDGALEMARRGFRVFRVMPNGRDPYRGGVNEATSEPERVKRWFAAEPRLNYGVVTTGLTVLDVDVKKGPQWLDDYAELGKIPPTLVVTTTTGGFHIYLKGFDAGQRKIAPTIDVRGHGGYVVGPGSVIDGKSYRIHTDAPLAEIPGHIRARCSTPGQRDVNSTVPVAELDTDGAVAYARQLLEATAGAPEGQRNNELFRLAAVLKDRGLSEETNRDLLLELWCPRCDPPYLNGAEVERTVRSAYDNGRRPPGAEVDEFEDLSGDPDLKRWQETLACKAEKPRATAKAPDPFGASAAAMWTGKTPAPARFVIEHIVPEGYVTLLAAAGGRGKSLLGLQAMVCVAAGIDFLGFKVMQGSAAALFCEDDPDEIHRRTKAICNRLGVDFEKVGERLWPASHVGRDAILWTEKSGADKERLEAIRAAVAARPGLKLLILDGVSFLFAAPEYDRGQVTRFLVELTRIAQQHGLGVVLLHHESKTTRDDDVRAASGSTAWLNACRSVLKLATVDGQPDKRTLLQIKTNRGPRQLPITCTLDGSGFHALAGDRERQKALGEAVQRLMLSARERDVNLSPNAKSAQWYAPRWLHKNQDGTDFTVDEFKRAIGDLAAFGIVEIETYENKGDPCERYVWRGLEG
jgi:hypothetical protein